MAEVKGNPLDFSSKKKKKGKPAVAEAPQPTVAEAPQPTVAEMPQPAKEEIAQPVADLPDFGAKKKKKNPKMVTIEGEEADGAVEKVTDQLEAVDLTFATKKKKKPVVFDQFPQVEAGELPTAGTPAAKAPVEGVSEPSDAPSYTYDFLLNRVFAQIQANNPELMSDQKKRLVMVPPGMARVGTKKTQFTNFGTTCRLLHREPSHLAAYMFAELGTTGSVDANEALLIRGRYQSKHIEPVLRTYARMYVICSTCQSPETDLCKDSRLLFLQCRRCGSRVTVKSVTTGFQAVTGKRAAMRAKAQ